MKNTHHYYILFRNIQESDRSKPVSVLKLNIYR